MGGRRSWLRRCRRTGTSDTETQEYGNGRSGGDAGWVIKEMRGQWRLRFLDNNRDGRRFIAAKGGMDINTEEDMTTK